MGAPSYSSHPSWASPKIHTWVGRAHLAAAPTRPEHPSRYVQGWVAVTTSTLNFYCLPSSHVCTVVSVAQSNTWTGYPSGYVDHTWRWWLPFHGLCNGSSAVQVVTLQGCVYWLNMWRSVCMVGLQHEQLMSHCITRTTVATLTKYDRTEVLLWVRHPQRYIRDWIGTQLQLLPELDVLLGMYVQDGVGHPGITSTWARHPLSMGGVRISVLSCISQSSWVSSKVCPGVGGVRTGVPTVCMGIFPLIQKNGEHKRKCASTKLQFGFPRQFNHCF